MKNRTRKQKRHNKSMKGSGKSRSRSKSPPKLLNTINIHQILITDKIKDALSDYGVSSEKISKFKSTKLNSGFRLSRMEYMMDQTKPEFRELLGREPIEVKKAVLDGKPLGIKIDGKMMQLYEIINGRHRVTRAIIDDMESMDVQIL